MIFKGLKLFLLSFLIFSCFVSVEETIGDLVRLRKNIDLESTLDGSEEDVFEKDLEKYKDQNQLLNFEFIHFLDSNLTINWIYIFKYPHFVLKSILSPPPDL